MKKKIAISSLLLVIVTSAFMLGAYAASSVKLWINGKQVSADVKTINGTTYVPLRVVSEKLGANVKWDSANNVISIASAGSQHSYDNSQTTNETNNNTTTNNATTKKIGDPTRFNYGVNSADGVKLTWMAKNLTGKRIKYYTVNIRTLNSVNDPSYDQITGENKFAIKYVGPVEIDGDLVVFNLFTYQSTVHTIKIDSVVVEYFDGTKETITLGHATSDDSGFN